MSRPSPPILSRLRTALIVVAAAVAAAGVATIVDELPQWDLLQPGINDQTYTDLVLKTRGELPIDTAIRILLYDGAILDSARRVDRSALAVRLATLLDCKPRVVGVDFLMEDVRAEAPDGDTMLAQIIRTNPNLLIGVFHEDSSRNTANRFRLPPPTLGIPQEQLGCINVDQDDDRAIRTWRAVWGGNNSRHFPSLALRLAERSRPESTRSIDTTDDRTYVIDYAANVVPVGDEGSGQVFPSFPLEDLYRAVMNDDTVRAAFYRNELRGRTVLVGYGETGGTQVTTIVDKFSSPFRPNDNSLPDMHGVVVHANILNSILRGRVVEVVPVWANILWGAALIAVMLGVRRRIERSSGTTRRTVLGYSSFGFFFLLGALLPVLAYRYLEVKFSIHTPVAGVLLAVPSYEALSRAVELVRDVFRRRRLRRLGLPDDMERVALNILRPWNVQQRRIHLLHTVSYLYQRLCIVVIDAARRGALPFDLDESVRVLPAPRRMADVVNDPISAELTGSVRSAARCIRTMTGTPLLVDALALARSLSIALNEIRRHTYGEQSGELVQETELRESDAVAEGEQATIEALMGRGESESIERFDALYRTFEEALVLAGAEPSAPALIPAASSLEPLLHHSRCRQHKGEEVFVFIGMQEDANNRDDYFDLVYAGCEPECLPERHIGLSAFKEAVLGTTRDE